jgi:hypothetical protein
MPIFRLVTTAVLSLCALTVQADTQRLDDSRSHTVPPTAQMEWTPQTRADRNGAMEAWVRVNIHIDMRDWVGRSGRIYMVLPNDGASGIEAEWTARGPLRSGRLVAGERSLVFAGTVRSADITDQLLVHLRSDPDWPSNSRRLNFHFEIDPDPVLLKP